MSITFNEIGQVKTPGVYCEIDNSLAIQGLTGKESCGLFIGRKSSNGTAEFNKVYPIYNSTTAAKLGGIGSELHRAAIEWFKLNPYNALKLVAVEQKDGQAAAYTLEITAESAKAGEVYLMIAGISFTIDVSESMSTEDLAAAIIDAVNEELTCPVTAAKGEGNNKVVLTAKNKGTAGNDIDVRLNYYSSQETAEGVVINISQTAEGSGNASLEDTIAALGDEYFTDMATTLTDEANLKLLRTMLDKRFSAMIRNESTLYLAEKGTMSDLMTLSEKMNSPHIVLAENYQTPTEPFIRAIRLAAICAREAQLDPARQYRTLVLEDDLPANKPLTASERDILLSHGVATFITDSSGNVAIERITTTYQKSSLGSKDESYLDLTTVKTLIYLRWSYVERMQLKYPRHKLAGDNYEVRPGQAIATPKVIAAEALALAKDWLAAGLIEEYDSFKDSMVTERNALDVNRIDQLLRPDIINNLMVIACKIQFKL